MEKNKLVFLPFAAGIALLVCSWWLSYPLSIDSVNDVIFNHLSLLYWISLPLLLASLFMINFTSKNNSLKWIAAIGIVLTIYSLSYFYYMLPSSDSQTFRGLTEYFIKTKDLDPSKPYHSYFQWPAFFLLNDMATSVSGMGLQNFEFLLYAIIGFLLATSLYIYAYRAHKNGALLSVAAFFVAMFYFLNYQDVPFSLAFGLLFVLFILETRQKNFSVMLTILVLFIGILFIHAFVPLFYILYLVMRFILKRDKQYGYLVLITLFLYFTVQIIQAPTAFFADIRTVMIAPGEYSSILNAIQAPVSNPTDKIAQIFSRSVPITTAVVCFAGFALISIKRKLRDLDKAIFLTGIVYSASGIILSSLGSRAIALTFIPISLGSSYFLKTRFRPYVISLFLVLLILFAFVPLHGTFYTNKLYFQTKEAYQTENFWIDHNNWTNSRLILAHTSVIGYLQTKQPSFVTFEDDAYSPLFPRIKEYDCIVYTVGLGINLQRFNYTKEDILNEENLNVVYNNGFSFVSIKSSNYSQTPG